MISYHRCQQYTPQAFGSGFECADVTELGRIGNCMSRFVWSGIVWEGGQRRQDKFLMARFCVLDFDSGEMTLAQAEKSFCDVNHVIGTTKSHQVPKGGKPAVDRFRVLLVFQHDIKALRDYRYNMTRLIAQYPADKACIDGARFFYPCNNIVSIVDDADLWPVLKTPETFEMQQAPEAREATAKLAALTWQRYQQLPRWTDKFLKRGECFSGKGREVSAFMVACEMKLAGISQDEAYSLVLKSPFDRNDFNAEREMQHAVNSAYKK